VGDIHRSFDLLNELIQIEKPDLILQCGDFGILPNETCVENGDVPILFCDGNHDAYDQILPGTEVAKNVFHMRRGAIVYINNQPVLFIGGADSVVDRAYRTENVDWFPELETISADDLGALPKRQAVHTVISHTCPNEFCLQIPLRFYGRELSKDALSHVLHRYMPKRWLFGHYHAHMRGNDDWCEWECLSIAGDVGWWRRVF